MLRTLHAIRYVTPLREGGSLPAVVEAEDDGMYVLKFRGAGQGTKALIAEIVTGELARALGLPVPEQVFMELDPVLGRNEPDYEIRSLLNASAGLNFAMDYLPGSITYDPLARLKIEAELASQIVWFDAWTTNIDRTARNTNMLTWHRKLYLIDHGAALFFHHNWQHHWPIRPDRAPGSFPQVKDHVLLPLASEIEKADVAMRARIRPELLESIVALIPEQWLEGESGFATPADYREAYTQVLLARAAGSESFVKEAIDARSKLI